MEDNAEHYTRMRECDKICIGKMHEARSVRQGRPTSWFSMVSPHWKGKFLEFHSTRIPARLGR